MCKKFKLVANIEETSIETLIAYFSRLARVYVIFLIFLVYSYFSYQQGTSGETAALINLIIYTVNCLAVVFPIATTCTYESLLPAFLTSIISLFYGIYTAGVILSEKDSEIEYILLNIFGLIFLIIYRGMTVFILYKLRQKIKQSTDTDISTKLMHNNV